ncbi:MAG: DUF5666 domain-containing protein [Candidatus Doudnabacteria bacterium]|jgi:hypothetical protein
MISKKTAVLFSIFGLVAGTAGTIALQTQASNATSNSSGMRGRMMQRVKPTAAGTVSAVNGNTLTIKDTRTGTTYSVDASAATLEKFTGGAVTPTVITITDIKVGDHVQVQGTISGTTIAATKITDGQMGKKFGPRGQMGVAGTVSAVSGNTITLTGKNGVTYTIEAGSANVKKVSTINVSNIAVGDTLMVAGDKSGTTITAKNIMDGEIPGNSFQK